MAVGSFHSLPHWNIIVSPLALSSAIPLIGSSAITLFISGLRSCHEKEVAKFMPTPISHLCHGLREAGSGKEQFLFKHQLLDNVILWLLQSSLYLMGTLSNFTLYQYLLGSFSFQQSDIGITIMAAAFTQERY